MKRVEINKSIITKEARILFKKGTSKQETFQILSEKYKSSKVVSDILKNIPSLQAAKKYGVWNFLLLVLLLLTTLFFVKQKPTISTFGIFLWYGILLYIVARMLVKYYVYVALLSSITIISLTCLLFFFDSSQVNWIEIGLLLILTISTLILPIWLEKKLCPKPNETKEVYTNSEGQQRQKIVYEFKD